ncbi:MAG: molybdopterin molybdotransferase MoeA [Bacteroidales bacterium]|nr:molybdopterin molybdotransferase MoeA [Bacteroidales bacterium]
MITFDEAFDIVINSAKGQTTERVTLENAVGRILAEDATADMDMPPFNKSAVDGYACKRSDIGEAMEVVEVIAAGRRPVNAISEGQCSQIMTGAMIPEGADTVIMVEDTEKADGNKIRFTGRKTSANICYTAEDIHAGQLVLKKGTLLRPQELAILATFGFAKPVVYKKPVVGVISTGDELVESDVNPAISQIRNSNSTQTIAQIITAGAEFRYFGIARDTEADTREKIGAALSNTDIVILTGGVSMGEFDYVPKVLQDLGITIRFKSIAVQPGRPTVFGVKEHKYIFGLPGNPVSSFVQFELLVKPLIHKLMGHDYQPSMITLPMGETYTRKKTTRKTLMPVYFKDGLVFPVEYHGSAHIHAFVAAQGILAIEIGKTTLLKGELVDVRQI